MGSWPRQARGALPSSASLHHADGDEHPVGETWAVIMTGFNKFEDILYLHVRDPQGRHWLLPLDWHAGQQDDVLERWGVYVRPAA